jgi:uncharacterized protein YndB with AHSA1/START domain
MATAVRRKQAPKLKDLVLTRFFDAPREVVFQAWTEPQHLVHWWGPKGFTNPVCEGDIRPGGSLRIVMRGPNGVEYPMTAVFRKIVEPERLVFLSQAYKDAQGRYQLEVLVTVVFSDQDGKTRMDFRAQVITATPAAAGPLAGMETGWSQSLDRLSAHVAPH